MTDAEARTSMRAVIPDAVPHYAADGTVKHFCTAFYCPDMEGSAWNRSQDH